MHELARNYSALSPGVSGIGDMKYPVKWGIYYGNKSYMIFYGKKKAYDMLYKLSNCLQGLAVKPVLTERKALLNNRSGSYEYYKRWVANNKDKVRAYQKEYRLKKSGKMKE